MEETESNYESNLKSWKGSNGITNRILKSGTDQIESESLKETESNHDSDLKI